MLYINYIKASVLLNNPIFLFVQWERLLDAKIWMDAAAQMFFTLGLGYGALISFASYMPIKNNCVRDAYTVVFINCGTSIFAGIVVFSILGHREYVTGLSVTEVCSKHKLNIKQRYFWSIHCQELIRIFC